MRLLYWYTRFLSPDGKKFAFHGLEEFELNLSTNAQFHYCRLTNSLLCEKVQTPLPDGFWGKGIYNLHVLTGSNGAGKSTIMNKMMDTLYRLYCGTVKFDDEIIILAEINGELYLLPLPCSSIETKDISTDFSAHYCRPDNPLFTIVMKALSQTKLIYLTNTLTESDDRRVMAYDYRNHIRYHFLYDCSTCGLIRYDERDDCRANNVGDLLQLYFSNEVYKQVKFVCAKRKDILEKLQNKSEFVPVPKELNITIHRTNNYNVLVEYTNTLTPSEQLINRVCAACYDSFYHNILRQVQVLSTSSLQRGKYPYSLDYDQWQDFFKDLYNQLPVKTDYNTILLKRCLRFVRFLCRPIPDCIGVFDMSCDLTALNTGENFTFSLTLSENTLIWLSQLMEYYRMTCSPDYFLDFNWGLSSGETNILRLFSSLYYIFGFKYYDYHEGRDAICNISTDSNAHSLCDSILLFLDEADLTYHPEWQRQFVSLLTAFLPELFNEDCGIHDIQLLLSTHSPLLIGDIPKNNVSYLGMEAASGQLETFGQNIHLILKDSFFLSHGTVGAFAEEKINNAAKTLIDLKSQLRDNRSAISVGDENNYERIIKKLQDCRCVIDLVAPGILKNKLFELYWDVEHVLSDETSSREKLVRQMSREKLESIALLYFEEHPEERHD